MWTDAPMLLIGFRTHQAFVFQVSYQGLDTENQRLQKALENSSKKIQQLEAELREVETENQMLQRNLEELKISSKHLEQLEQEVGTERKLVVSNPNPLLWKRTHPSPNGRELLVDLCHNFSCLCLLIVPGRMRPGGLASGGTLKCVVWHFSMNIYSLISIFKKSIIQRNIQLWNMDHSRKND